ncbi:MAG: hypothetical protein J6Y71_09450 [Ruminococcus sp.]|nr:hypothetical protein [Ruminococcus sp.]
MKKQLSFITALTCLICTALSGCGKEYSEDESIVKPPPVTTITQTTTLITTSTIPTTTKATTTTTSTTTTTATTTAITTATTTEAAEQPIRDPEDTSPPFGDLTGAYVCVGGTAFFPSVYVLTEEEVCQLANGFNSMDWTEIPKSKYVGPTPGPSDIEYYIYKDGKFSELDDFCSKYIEDGYCHYYRSTVKEDYKNSDFAGLFTLVSYGNNRSRMVSTHLSDQFIQPIREYSDQERWALVWDDVLPFIEENGV